MGRLGRPLVFVGCIALGGYFFGVVGGVVGFVLDTMLGSLRGTTTATGLTVRAALHDGRYQTGERVSDAEVATVDVSRGGGPDEHGCGPEPPAAHGAGEGPAPG